MLSFTPPVEPDLTVGLARTVVENLESRSRLPLHAVNVLGYWRPTADADQLVVPSPPTVVFAKAGTQ